MTASLDMLSDESRALLKAAPHPMWCTPMLATLTHDHFSDPDWIFERKLDGERALAFRNGDRVRLMSRNQKDLNKTYPELVDAIAAQTATDFVADGEIVAFDGNVTSFSRLQARMQIKNAETARQSPVSVFYYLFDLMHFEGHDLSDLPLRDRKSLLKRALRFSDPLRFTLHRDTKGEAFLREACKKGWEGLIAKRANAVYRHARSTDWLKFKCTQGQELVIGGFTEPKGDRRGFGALLLGYYDTGGALHYAGKVGTGFDDEFLCSFRQKLDRLVQKTSPFAEEVDTTGTTFVEPQFVGEIGFTEWTNSGKLRHPRFLGLRDDKPAAEVTRETGNAT